MAAKNPVAPTAIGLTRYVHFGFFLAGFLLTYILNQLIGAAWGLVFASNDLIVVGIAVAIAGGATIYAWRHPRLNMLAKEIATELSKVTWPTRKELSAFTVTVIVTTAIAAVILGLFDAFWSTLTGIFYR